MRILKIKYANICAHLRIMNSRKPKAAGDNADTKSCPVRLFKICPNRYKTEWEEDALAGPVWLEKKNISPIQAMMSRVSRIRNTFFFIIFSPFLGYQYTSGKEKIQMNKKLYTNDSIYISNENTFIMGLLIIQGDGIIYLSVI